MPVDMVPWIPVVGALGGAIIGGAASFFGGVVGHWLGLKREREAREHEAERARRLQWTEFQLKTLVDLQDALDKAHRASFRVADLGGKAATGKIPMEKAIESEAAFHIARNRALRLTARVEDERVRVLSGDLCTLIEEIKQLAIKFYHLKRYDTSELDSRYAEARRRFAAANDAIGEVIRGSQRPD